MSDENNIIPDERNVSRTIPQKRNRRPNNTSILSKNKRPNPAQQKKVMVCVTRQKTCERLIRQGAAMADSMGAELMIVHAVTQNEQVLGNADESEALELLFRLANDYGAEMQMIRCENALDGLADTAQKNDVGLMILGASPQSAQSLSEKIRARLPYMSFIVLGANTWVDQIA